MVWVNMCVEDTIDNTVEGISVTWHNFISMSINTFWKYVIIIIQYAYTYGVSLHFNNT